MVFSDWLDAGHLDDWSTAFTKKFWTGKKRIAFYRRLAVYVENGISTRESLIRLRKQLDLRGVGKWDADRVAYQELESRITNGETLAQALDGWAPAGERSIIRAGELAGNLPSALRSAIGNQGIVGNIIGKILMESLDPMIMFGLGAFLVYITGTKMIPPIELVAKPDTWPMVARMLLPMAAVAESPWTPVFLALSLMGSVAAFGTMPYWSRHGRKWVEKLPPWSVYRLLSGAQWLMGFARLIEAGVGQPEALAIQAEYAKPWLKDRLLDARTRMQNGRDLGRALIEGGFDFPDRILADDLSAFSNAHDFPNLVMKLGEEWLQEGEKRIFAVIRLLSMVANIVVNVIILLVIFGVFDLQNVMMASAHG
ncbi:type II secretion system F family protein [Acidithiobacillus sp. IBUN Pt1247-S3]|uniref:type II secretion system F family protein n=1 Tax=Acidithiobacillus sp. IBUN Pt1247-S3 TaxID=3166642 RepID=UPI0034E50E89